MLRLAHFLGVNLLLISGTSLAMPAALKCTEAIEKAVRMSHASLERLNKPETIQLPAGNFTYQLLLDQSAATTFLTTDEKWVVKFHYHRHHAIHEYWALNYLHSRGFSVPLPKGEPVALELNNLGAETSSFLQTQTDRKVWVVVRPFVWGVGCSELGNDAKEELNDLAKLKKRIYAAFNEGGFERWLTENGVSHEEFDDNFLADKSTKSYIRDVDTRDVNFARTLTEWVFFDP